MNNDGSPAPDMILQIGFGFWGSKVLLSAVELGLFTLLAQGPQDFEVIRRKAKLHPRSARDFLDALVALDLLDRNGQTYSNTPSTDLFLDRNKPSYIGAILEMAGSRLYGFWGNLTEALLTGKSQNENKTGEDLFETLYSNSELLGSFVKGMTGVSLGAARAIAQRFPWEKYKTFADIGAAEGALPVQVALAHPHLSGIGYDLPVLRPIFEDYVLTHQLESRIRFEAGDFFRDALPEAEVLVMGHILHDWGLDDKLRLLAKAYNALPQNGALIVYESIIDDDRRKNAFGLLMSLNMLIETRDGFDFTGADCIGWMKTTGFREARVEHLVGPDSMVIGIK